MSATRSNISAAAWRTRRLLENCGTGLAPLGLARGLETGEIVTGVMRRARERRSRDHQESFGVSDRLERLEFIRWNEANHLMMLARRLQILPDGDEIDVGCAQIVHHLQDLVPLFTQPNHDA